MKLDTHDQNLFTKLKWAAREPEIADEMLRLLIRIDTLTRLDSEVYNEAQKILNLIISRTESRMVA
jgi:hypothetical protein